MAEFNFSPITVQQQPQTSLGDMLNIARGAQAYSQAQQLNPMLQQKAALDIQSGQQSLQKGNIELQSANRLNEEAIAKKQFFSNPDNFLNSDGKIDLVKINETLPKIAPLTAGDEITKYSTLSKNQSDAETAKRGLTKDKREIIGSTIGALGYAGVQDPKSYQEAISRISKMYPDDAEVQKLAKSYASTLSFSKSNEQIPKIAQGLAQEMFSPTTQYEKFAPQPGTIDTGAEIVGTVTKPSIAGGIPSIQQTSPIATKGLTPISGGLGIEAEGVKSDYNNTLAEAGTAQRDIGVLQKMKSLSRKAILGTEQGRRAYFEGLNTLLGRSEDEIRKSATDELEKNAAILATSGHTDAQRALFQAANPSTKMTERALQNASDQVIAQKKLALLKSTHMGNYVRDPSTYAKELRTWQTISEPQALNYPNMTVEEKKAMFNAMKPEEQVRFQHQLEALELLDQRYKLGLFP